MEDDIVGLRFFFFFSFFFSFIFLCDLDLSMTRRTDTLPHATQSHYPTLNIHVHTYALLSPSRIQTATTALPKHLRLLSTCTRARYTLFVISHTNTCLVFFPYSVFICLSSYRSRCRICNCLKFYSYLSFFFPVHSWSATSFFFLSIIWVNLSQRKKNSPCSGELIRFFFWYLVCFV